MNKLTLEQKIATKIRRSRKNVFLRKDFAKLGGYDQVGVALHQITSNGGLIKLGYGLYSKAVLNPLTGKPRLASLGGFYGTATEALNRLKVNWGLGPAYRDYNEKKTTQVPVRAQVTIYNRFNRKIRTSKNELLIVRGKNDWP